MAKLLNNNHLLLSTPPHVRVSASPGRTSFSALRFLSFNCFPSLQQSSSDSDFHGQRIVPQFQFGVKNPRTGSLQASSAQMSLTIGKAQKWWEKGIQPNMREISSAQDLVDSLLSAGEKVVIVDFFSPGCGGCRALHPKICQIAEMNPDVQFLQVNHEEHKSMCYSLNVHVLPFFRFYRGAHGRLCSFSCTNATVKKFKDALAKHTTDRCSLGPPKGLEEKELLALASNKDLSFNYTPNPVQPSPTPALEIIAALQPTPSNLEFPLPYTSKATEDTQQQKVLSTNIGR
ncbi:thioredoxin-like 1-1, chloroplastic [Macadamia integrifolia]|uniref:thioredoxin-like 1-1, chloroplastic n=1 Tax=Macadamia integrifolia TaxID=60698 RepID=UPI001C533B24|nr:thioredoxin-like 1-1, chloroplastic [Macadamia integrifolia]